MHHALAGGQPLHIALAKTGPGAQGVGVVDQAFAHDGHGLKAAVRVRRETRYCAAVVHAPAVLAAEILANVSASQRGLRRHLRISHRVSVVVVGAKQEGVDGIPGEAQGLGGENGVARHSVAFKQAQSLPQGG